MTDLLTRLRQMARAEHDDLDIANEAAEEIINLRVDVHVLREMLERYKRDAARYRWLRDEADGEGVCVVHIDYWSDEYIGQAHCEVYGGEFLDRAIDHARRAEEEEK